MPAWPFKPYAFLFLPYSIVLIFFSSFNSHCRRSPWVFAQELRVGKAQDITDIWERHDWLQEEEISIAKGIRECLLRSSRAKPQTDKDSRRGFSAKARWAQKFCKCFHALIYYANFILFFCGKLNRVCVLMSEHFNLHCCTLKTLPVNQSHEHAHHHRHQLPIAHYHHHFILE